MRKKRHLILHNYLIMCLILILGCMSVSGVEASTDLEQVATMEGTTGKLLEMARVSSSTGNRKNLRMLHAIQDSFFKSQLENPNQRAIYEALEADEDLTRYNKDSKKTIRLTEKVFFNAGVTKDTYKTDPGYSGLFGDFCKATHAYIRDRVGEYWLKEFAMAITSTDIKNGFITEIKLYPNLYYDGILEEREKTHERVTEFARNVEGNTLYEKVKYIHDGICELITYPDVDINAEYYHTIPCAWIDTYDHLGVCEAYAKSFAYVCKLSGIECILVSGGSKVVDGKVESRHMWNYVKMDDGQWYLVDCTWDDSKTGNTQYRYFLAGSEASGGNHLPVGCFSADDVTRYAPFSLPALSAGTYPAVLFINADEKVSCDVDDQVTVTVDYLPSDATLGTKLTFESADRSIAVVSDTGVVTGKGAGKTTITIRSEAFPSIFTTCEVEILDHEPGEAEITKAPSCLEKGKTEIRCTRCRRLLEEKEVEKLSASVKLNMASLPLQVGCTAKVLKIEEKDPIDYLKSWKSSNTKIVTVDKTTGKLTGKRTGTATVTLTMASGAKATCKVTVKKYVRATKLQPVERYVTIKKKNTYQIKLTKTPVTAKDTIYYSSSNTSLATVTKKGLVTAKKAGTVTIRIRTQNGVKTSVKVTIR